MNRQRKMNIIRCYWGAALAAVLICSPNAFGQFHGVRIGKSCVSPKCVGDVLDCTFEVGHDDDFGDTLELLDAFDNIDPKGHNTRLPAVGNLPIVNVGGNTNCTVGGSLPCLICPAGSAACGPVVPNQGQPGVVTFGIGILPEDTYNIQPDDPNPLPDRASIRVSDKCDAPGTTGCSSVPNTIQFTASTTILSCDDGNECTRDICVNGQCFFEPECETADDCDAGDACLIDLCDLDGCCDTTPLCPPGDLCCADGTNCNVDGLICTVDFCGIDGCCDQTPLCPPGTICCADGASCNDNNVCTTDTCAGPGCCENTPIVCPTLPCQRNVGCDPVQGCLYVDDCREPGPDCCPDDGNPCTDEFCDVNTGICGFTPDCTINSDCNDNNVCTTDICTGESCCENTPIICPPLPCQRNVGCDPVQGCLYVDDCREPGTNCCPDDGNPCTAEFCDQATGICGSTPDCTINADCNDSNVCTQDTCVNSCCVNTTIPCPPRPCERIVGCDPILGCQYEFDCRQGIGCCPDDGFSCTNEICLTVNGQCQSVPDNSRCTDHEDCRLDICDPTNPGADPTTGCVKIPRPLSTPCEADDDFCTIDHCDGEGDCVLLSEVVCVDSDCEECNPALGRCQPIIPIPEGCLVCEAECPPMVKAKVDIWNANEHSFSGTERCISSWDQTLLSRYTNGRPGNNFMRNILQTDKGKARIDGMASTVCNNPERPPSVNAPLLGLSIREIVFSNGREFAASELTGQGYEIGAIAYDLFGGPPPGEATFDRTAATKPTPAGRGATVDPVGTTGISPISGGPQPPLAVAVPPRGNTSQKGSLLVFPKFEIKWDAAGNLIQDTIIELTNDASTNVSVQSYLVHGDLCMWVDNNFVLTGNHPVYWSVLTGQPGLGSLGGGMSPATVLGDGCPDDDITNPGGRVLRGYLLLWAVDTATNAEIRWNHLSGSATVIKYRDTSAWEYNAWAFQAVLDVEQGQPLLPPYGLLWLDGREYESAPALLLLDFFASGSTLMLEGGPLGIDTDLTLWAALKDLRQDPDLDNLIPNGEAGD